MCSQGGGWKQCGELHLLVAPHVQVILHDVELREQEVGGMGQEVGGMGGSGEQVEGTR